MKRNEGESAPRMDFYARLLGWEKCEMYGCPAVSSQNGIVFLFMPKDDFDYIQPCVAGAARKAAKANAF